MPLVPLRFPPALEATTLVATSVSRRLLGPAAPPERTDLFAAD